MQTTSRIIWIYAAIVLIGGIIGHFIAHSMVSLIASSIVAILLIGCGYFINKGQGWAHCAATTISALLLAFFAYRFSLAYKFMPAGLMVILTACLLVYLLMKGKKNCCNKQNCQ